MEPTARTQRIREAIARLEDAFPAHQARAIIGYAEALGTEPAERINDSHFASRGLDRPTLARAAERFRGLLDAWEVALTAGGMGSHEARRLEICAGNLREAINRVERGNV